MRALIWIIRASWVLFLFAFAVKNTDPVTSSSFFDTSWQAPMIIVVLAFFAAGALFGSAVAAGDDLRPAPPVDRALRRELNAAASTGGSRGSSRRRA